MMSKLFGISGEENHPQNQAQGGQLSASTGWGEGKTKQRQTDNKQENINTGWINGTSSYS